MMRILKGKPMNKDEGQWRFKDKSRKRNETKSWRKKTNKKKHPLKYRKYQWKTVFHNDKKWFVNNA